VLLCFAYLILLLTLGLLINYNPKLVFHTLGLVTQTFRIMNIITSGYQDVLHLILIGTLILILKIILHTFFHMMDLGLILELKVNCHVLVSIM